MPTTLPIDLLVSSDLGSSSTDNLTNDDTPTLEGFAGVALFGATVDFTSDLDGVLGSTTVGADGIWQITLPQLSQGNNWVTATITAPDTSVTTETIKLGIDTYAAITIDQPLANNGVFDGNRSTLTGTAVGAYNGDSVRVILSDSDNKTIYENTTVSDGIWEASFSYSKQKDLGVGPITVEATVTDRAGNVASDVIAADGSVVKTYFTLDFDLADDSNSGSRSDILTNDNTPTFVSTSRSLTSSTVVTFHSDIDGDLAGQVISDGNGYWYFMAPQLSDGLHTITYTGTAFLSTALGNAVTTETTTVNIDTYAELIIDQPIGGDGAVDGALSITGTFAGIEPYQEVTVVVTDSNGDTVTGESGYIFSDGVWSVDFSDIDMKALAIGPLSIQASAVDKAGNVAQDFIAADGSVAIIRIDLLDSSDLGVSNTDNLTSDDTPTIESYVGVERAGLIVDLTSDLDGVLGSTTVGADGFWQFTLPQLSQGNNWITATVTEADSSVVSTSLKLGIDTYAVVTINAPIMPSPTEESLLFTGSVSGVEDGREVSITFTDSTSNTVTATAIVTGSQWQLKSTDINPNSLLAGDITIEAQVSDRAGNVAINSTVSNIPFDFLGSNIVAVELLTNGESAIVFDGLNSLVVQHFDASFNSLTTPLSLTVPDVFDEVLLKTIDTATGNYALYTDGNIWTFDVNGNLLNTEPVRLPTYFPDDFDFSDPIEPTFLHVADNGFMLAKEYPSGTGSIEQSFFIANSTASILFFDANGIKFEEVQFNFFRRGGPGPAGTYANGSYLESIELVNLANGDTLVLVTEDLTGGYSRYQYEGYVFSVDYGVVREVFDFELNSTQELETPTITSDDTSFTVTTASEAVTYDYRIYREINLLDSSDTGVSSTDDITNDTTPTLEGYIASEFVGGTVELSNPFDGILGTTIVDANGYWQFTTPEVTPKHQYAVTATITALDGTETTDKITLDIDNYAEVTINPTPTINFNTDESFVISGSVFEAPRTSNIYTVNITFTDSNNNTVTTSAAVSDFQWQVSVNELGLNNLLSGNITIDAQVVDRAGNVGTDSVIVDMPVASLGSNILTSIVLANGDVVILFDDPKGFVVQHFDSSFNEATLPVYLTAADEVGDFQLEIINPTTGGYALYADEKVWVFDEGGTLLTESIVPLAQASSIYEDLIIEEPAFFHATTDGFVLLEEQSLPTWTHAQHHAHGIEYDNVLQFFFFDDNGVFIAEERIDSTYGDGAGPTGEYESNTRHGLHIASKALVNLPNGDILAILHAKPFTRNVYDSSNDSVEVYKAVIFDINGGMVDQIASFDIDTVEPSDDFTITVGESSFTLTTDSDAVAISYAPFYPIELPTVNEVDTSNTHPWLSGTFDADETTNLTISVDGKNYTLGVDANFYQHANNDNIWVLKPKGFYHLGEHDVVVTATNSNGLSVVDQTTGELTITRDMVAPRVNLPKQIYNKRPAIGGSFDEAATEELTVELDGTVYTLGVDAELSNHLNNKWVLNLSTLETPLSDGVYDVIVNTTDANSVTLQDASTGELTIGMLAPTVYELESTNFKPVLRGFYDADFGDGLTVTVNGDSYTLGVDGELTTHVSNDYVWVLRPSNALNFGNNDIQVVATDTKGKDKTDITSDEIHIYQSKSQAVDGDVLITQEGDDTITINDNTFTQINAGLGVDTLVLDGDAINLNFANIQDIDVVDMSGSASTANTLTLTLDDVLTKTDNSSLSILGDSADTVTLATADNWNTNGSQVIDGVTYDGYDSGAASLLIEQGVVVQVV